MAMLEMQKIEIAALLSDSQHIVERLQRRGVMELTDIRDEELVKVNTSSSTALFERSLATAKSALEIFSAYVPEKNSPLAFLNGRTPISTQRFAQLKEENAKALSLCHFLVESEKKINEEKGNITKFTLQIDQLLPWEGLDLPQNWRGTEKTGFLAGILPMERTKEEIEALLIQTDENAVAGVDIVGTAKGHTLLGLSFLLDSQRAVNEALRKLDFAPLTSQSPLTYAEEIAKARAGIQDARENIENLEEKIRQCAPRRHEIEFLIDSLQMQIDKYRALAAVGMTEKTIILDGFVPKKFVPGLIAEFQSKYTLVITVSEPEPQEEVPVLLQNGKFSEPMEGITEMYALPGKKDIDPSAVMAFFYYLFFGMMLSDAGYGLLMVIATVFVLKKFTVEGSLRKSLVMFRNCGVSTLFWGVLFGSWFGDLPQIIATNFFHTPTFSTALWFEPLADPIKLLLFSFGLGICHLFLGLAVNFHLLWKAGKKMDAVCDVIPVYITILGAAPVGAGILVPVAPILTKIGMIFIIVGALLIVLTAGRSSKNIFLRFFGGIYGLYNIATGYLGDILSYSRLLALGLATGSIAGVINLIATMPENSVLKAIMLITVGTAGHLLNMGINLLGAYVHSDRLQFVELFSKFYEGGGKAFAPLKADTKYFRFKKENIYND